jgi:dihydropyrimidinase
MATQALAPSLRLLLLLPLLAAAAAAAALSHPAHEVGVL